MKQESRMCTRIVGAGSIVSMALLSVAIAIPLSLSAR